MEFQFLLVRLKACVVPPELPEIPFQFLLVRLKAVEIRIVGSTRARWRTSGTIKRQKPDKKRFNAIVVGELLVRLKAKGGRYATSD